MERIRINMLSNADKVDGQGVGSAYLEQVSLIKDEFLMLLLMIQLLLILFIVIPFYLNI